MQDEHYNRLDDPVNITVTQLSGEREVTYADGGGRASGSFNRTLDTSWIYTELRPLAQV